MSTSVRLPEPPARIARLPIDYRGFPIPWFVEGTDFRVTSRAKVIRALRERLCWVCGEPLTLDYTNRLQGTFAVGPMCVVNRTSSEPPSHRECADYSTRACPFLAHPERPRRAGGLPEDADSPGGVMILRNPGVTALVHCTRWSPTPVPNGLLVKIERIEGVKWMTTAREATGPEVLASIESGLPALMELADEEPGGMPFLARLLKAALRYTPPGEPREYRLIARTLDFLP